MPTNPAMLSGDRPDEQSLPRREPCWTKAASLLFQNFYPIFDFDREIKGASNFINGGTGNAVLRLPDA